MIYLLIMNVLLFVLFIVLYALNYQKDNAIALLFLIVFSAVDITFFFAAKKMGKPLIYLVFTAFSIFLDVIIILLYDLWKLVI